MGGIFLKFELFRESDQLLCAELAQVKAPRKNPISGFTHLPTFCSVKNRAWRFVNSTSSNLAGAVFAVPAHTGGSCPPTSGTNKPAKESAAARSLLLRPPLRKRSECGRASRSENGADATYLDFRLVESRG